MPAFIRTKEEGRFRYIGMSTSVDAQYAAQMEGRRRYPLDFIQVDSSIANRTAADEILPLAEELGVAVLVNIPFGGRGRGAAARDGAPVAALAVYERGAGEVMDPERGKRMGEVFAGVAELVAEGRFVEGARAFIEGSDVLYSEEDLATGAPAEFWEAAAPRLALFLEESRQAAGSGQPGATSPETLGRITMPILLLHGGRSSVWFDDSVRHVAGEMGRFFAEHL